MNHLCRLQELLITKPWKNKSNSSWIWFRLCGCSNNCALWKKTSLPITKHTNYYTQSTKSKRIKETSPCWYTDEVGCFFSTKTMLLKAWNWFMKVLSQRQTVPAQKGACMFVARTYVHGMSSFGGGGGHHSYSKVPLGCEDSSLLVAKYFLESVAQMNI